MTDLDSLPFHHPDESAPTMAGSVGRRCGRHVWVRHSENITDCLRCGTIRDEARAKRGKQSRNYGNRAELKVARTYGGDKIGAAGGPVDVQGRDWNTQVKTHRRLPPAEWRKAFAAMSASRERMPRLLLRFVFPGGPDDYIVIPGKVWLEWFGRDEDRAA